MPTNWAFAIHFEPLFNTIIVKNVKLVTIQLNDNILIFKSL